MEENGVICVCMSVRTYIFLVNMPILPCQYSFSKAATESPFESIKK